MAWASKTWQKGKEKASQAASNVKEWGKNVGHKIKGAFVNDD